MKTLRKASFGLKGIAFVMLAGLLTANCSSKSNPTPATGKAGAGGAGTGGAGTTGAAGVTGNAGAGGGGTSGGAGTGAAGVAPDGGAGAGDASTGCDASGLVQEAGCMACATDPLFGCSTVSTTCIPFNNSSIPANIPKL